MYANLLWVYPALFDYLGNGFAVLSRIWTAEQFRESPAIDASSKAIHSTLQDTTTGA